MTHRTKINPIVLGLFIAILHIFAATTLFAEKLSRVETKSVCMINDKVFPKEQIPTVVEGRTYYGCCEMCASRLKTDKAARTSIDPVSGKEIDKATAVIGASADGKVYYFESEKTLQDVSSK